MTNNTPLKSKPNTEGSSTTYTLEQMKPFPNPNPYRPVMSVFYHLDRMEETFGPNPCDYLKLINPQGEVISLTCDSKRCSHCAPRKMWLISEQMHTGFGELAWIARLTNLENLNRALERAKKNRARHGDEFTYQIVGDPLQGWIVISDTQLVDEQRRMTLQDWSRRIIDLYQKAAARIRRSRALGRVSLVPLKRKAKEGTNWIRFADWGYPSHIAGQLQRHRINAERVKEQWDSIRERKLMRSALPDPY